MGANAVTVIFVKNKLLLGNYGDILRKEKNKAF
jgi:hypothetical protein